jgi:carboxymethylenebutenolidase
MDRRVFLAKSAAVTAGGLAMAQALLPRYARAQTISFTDRLPRCLRGEILRCTIF